MKTVNQDILDECELIEEGFPIKDCASWHYRHPDGRDFIAMVVDPQGSCWIEGCEQLEEGDDITKLL